MTELKTLNDLGSNAVLDTLRAWVASPEGQAELAAALIGADLAVKQLQAERTVTWQQMQEPMTI